MVVLKPNIQNNKYTRFLLLSTIISLVIFVLNLSVGFENHKAKVQNIKDFNDQEIVKGDIHPSNGGDTVMVEDTSEYQIRQFWDKFGEILIKFSPLDFQLDTSRPESCKLETNLIDPNYDGELYSESFLSNCLNLNYKEYKKLAELHKKFIKLLPDSYGSKTAQEYYHGDGIVMIGSGKYSVMTQLVIQILRERGTTLPIEVLIPFGQKDDEFCENLKNYNAKCIRPLIDENLYNTLKFSSYQIKILALISSSFENLLYLDSDSYPLHNLDNIFTNELYLETGFISWPDFWRRSTSPAFYKLAGKKIGKQIRNNIDSFSAISKFPKGKNLFEEVSYHDRAGTMPDGSSETSSIMINKFTHLQTLLLSFYYNANGPRLYYHLLTQGNFGQGDKETFVAAAHVLNKPYYQVKTKPRVGGELLHFGKTPRGTSMIQFDIFQDYDLYKQLQEKFGGANSDEEYDIYKIVNFFNEQNTKLMFIHYNLGKMDPLNLGVFKERRYGYDLKMIGFDFEFKNMELMNSMICNRGGHSKDLKLTNINFEYLRGKNVDEICGNLQNILKMMRETSDKVVFN